jgi:hypothetical protein
MTDDRSGRRPWVGRPLDFATPARALRGFSSAGRALAWQARGQGFESPKLHFELQQEVTPMSAVSAAGAPCEPRPRLR